MSAVLEREERATTLRKVPLVLIVDDQVSICETLAGVLEDEHFSTLSVNDGAQAVEVVREKDPDLVFLDIWMAGSDGLETLEKIKEISPRTEVIMISGHASIATALEATRRGAFDFIEKPLDIETIHLSAKRALERRRMAVLGDANEKFALSDGLPEHAKAPLLKHPGVRSRGLQGRNLGQRTLKRSIILYGQGLHSGQKSGLVLEPLPRNSGIHFANIGGSKVVPAFIDFVESTDFATTLRSGGAVAQTIEHLMATLHAYRISNLLIKCNGEVPILDGSAKEFCERVEESGIAEQGGEWFEIRIDERSSFKVCATGPNQKGKQEQISFEPAEQFIVSYELWYPEPVGKQFYEFALDSVRSFKDEIAPARTFGFMKDIERLQKADKERFHET